MKKELEQYFGCEVKIAEYKNKLPLPIFMTMRDIVMVEIYGVTFAIIDVMKETELSVAAMKKQKAKYEEALQCPVAYEVLTGSNNLLHLAVFCQDGRLSAHFANTRQSLQNRAYRGKTRRNKTMIKILFICHGRIYRA